MDEAGSKLFCKSRKELKQRRQFVFYAEVLNYNIMLTPEEIRDVSATADTASALSIVGSIFILICYVAFPSLRKFSFKLVASLALSDVLNQIFGFIGPTDTDMAGMDAGAPATPICYVQAVTESYFNLASVAWTTAIAVTLYLSVFRRVGNDRLERIYWRFALACWGIPVIFTAAPAFDHAYGPAGGWCWIVANKPYWRFIQFYGPLWIAAIFIAVIYVQLLMMIRGMLRIAGNDPTLQPLRTMIYRLRMYPFILLVVWLWASVNRVYETATGNQLLWLFMLQRIFSNLQGLMNAMAYGLNTTVRTAITEAVPVYYHRLCCRRCCHSDMLSLSRPTANSIGSPVARNPVVGYTPTLVNVFGEAEDVDDTLIHPPARGYTSGKVPSAKIGVSV